MPRSTAKSRQNVNGNSNVIQTIMPPPTNAMVSKTVPTASRRRTTVKREAGSATDTVTEQVFHRKSERRRVARDIFLVFEEEPSTRRSRGSSKKPAKPKFGHLKVEEPLKSKGLLRDIKNEPKCYMGGSSISSVNQQIERNTSKKKIVNSGTKSHFKVWSSEACTSHSPAYSNGNSLEYSKVSQEDLKSADDIQVARVNPIFLWAKQDNTRIIEVRCEDYDKRNRIRITKTSNGWRAIPRSDPTSSKVLKLYTSPLIKVKRENHIHEISHISQSLCNVVAENKPIVIATDTLKQDTFPGANDIGIQICGIDTANKQAKKSKKKKSKKRKRVFTCKKTTIKINVSNVDDTDLSNCIHTNNAFTSEICGDGGVAEEDDRVQINDCSSENNIFFSAGDIKTTHSINKGLMKTSSPFAISCVDDVMLNPTYQTADEDNCSFQLCPKTGLFLRNAHIGIEDDDDVEIVECSIHNCGTLDKLKNTASESKPINVDDNNESLEAKTRNLKDLLDDADLFQHCDDNANSDADLIDTLVKSSCENNLIQNNETTVKDTIDNLQNKNMNTAGNDLAQLITEVSDPPKSLSFNEAGEIEALNCELFQPNAYIDTFQKQPSTTITDTQLSTLTTALMQTNSLQPSVVNENSPDMSNDIVHNIGVNIVEDSPKDLSYKKREEICPPSESRSQCAVTSSSDVVKSPKLDDTSVLASSSETLKNLILEQFMKLNTISSHQKDPIELEKQMEITHLNTIYSKCRLPSNVIETVVIDDDDSATDENQVDGDEEPLKKRLRSNALPAKTKVDGEYNVKSKMVMNDKDPDPLTQLRLLIQNSQWKVPDPILVPKDRLSAVLASPAREIPLLITTRPELRLPEAFAYPEIIQNPNILVISMAQLEAILKNDLDVDKSKLNDSGTRSMSSPTYKQYSNKNGKHVNDFHVQTSHQTKKMSDLGSQIFTEDGSSAKTPINTVTMTKEESAKCSHIDSSLSSDINAATMAVLNQMLWLPYFGQISQDFMKSLKTPHSLTQKVASLLPFSGSKANGVQHLDEICDKSKRSQMPTNIPMLKQGKTDELTLFQKIVQHQMQSVINFSQVKSGTTERSTTNLISNNSTTEQSTQQNESIGHNLSNIVIPNNKNSNLSKNHKDVDQNYNHIVDATGKTYNLRSSIASRQSSDSNQYHNIKRINVDNKPRLTCKSLSNLLDPEHSQQQNMCSSLNTTIPCVPNVDGNFQKCINGIKDLTAENRNIDSLGGGCVLDGSVETSVKPNNSKILDTTNNLSKQKNKVVETMPSETGVRSAESSALSTEANIPLWHPLFGSNSKSAYSSPWQWTTVTAAGE